MTLRGAYELPSILTVRTDSRCPHRAREPTFLARSGLAMVPDTPDGAFEPPRAGISAASGPARKSPIEGALQECADVFGQRWLADRHVDPGRRTRDAITEGVRLRIGLR